MRAFTPYQPTADWTYYLQAARSCAAPTFMASNTLDTKVRLDSAHDASAELTLSPSNTHDGAFYLKLANGRYLSYAGECANTVVDT